MKKITLSFQVMAAIIAVTILQVGAGTAAAVIPPVLDPSTSTVTCTDYVTVRITATTGGSLCYWFYGSPKCKTAVSPVNVVFLATTSGITLCAKTYKSGNWSSPACGTYYCK